MWTHVLNKLSGENPTEYPQQTRFELPDFLKEPVEATLQQIVFNQQVEGLVLGVSEFKPGNTQGGTGKPFLDLTLFDSSGTVRSKVWEDTTGTVERALHILSEHAVIRVSGSTSEYPKGSGTMQLVVKHLAPETEVQASSLLPAASNHYDVNKELNALVALYESMVGPEKDITFAGLDKFWTKFCLTPAAKSHHHAFIGGLLVHVAQLAKIVDFLFSTPNIIENMLTMIRTLVGQMHREALHNVGVRWPEVSIDHMHTQVHRVRKMLEETPDVDWNNIRSRCLAGTFWHDLGKMSEYQYETKIAMHDEGKLVGHMALAVEALVELRIERGFAKEDILPLQHIIMSHHGKMEWGSPVWPQTLEGVLFHFVDYFGSKLG